MFQAPRLAAATFFVLLVGLNAICCVTPGNVGPEPLDQVLSEGDHAPPACITNQLREAYNYCPALPPKADEEPACQRVEAPVTWPSSVALKTPVTLVNPTRNSRLQNADRLFDKGMDQSSGKANRRLNRDAALRAYRSLLAKPAALGKAGSGYARLRLAKLLTSMDQPRAARRQLELVYRTHGKDGGLHELFAHARWLLLEHHGADPVSAVEGLRALHRDPGSTVSAATVGMVQALAAQLAKQGKIEEALAGLGELKRRHRAKACDHQAVIVRAAFQYGSKAATRRELDTMVAEYLLAAPSDKPTCGASTARLLLEVGQRWHRKTDRARPASPRFAADLFGLVRAHFKQAQLSRWGICTSLTAIANAQAEALYAAGDWAGCGPAFEAVIHADPSTKQARKAALGAVICRQTEWRQQRQSLSLLSAELRMAAQLERAQKWRVMLRSFHRYLCMSDAESSDHPAFAKTELARAQTFFDGGALWEAAIGFRQIAFRDSVTAGSKLAAQRYAELMLTLAADDVCRLEVIGDIERLRRRYCAASSGSVACTKMQQVQDDLRQVAPPML